MNRAMAPLPPSQIRDALNGWSRRLPTSLAVALDLIPEDTERAAIVRGAQILAIVRLTPIAMVASCLNAVILLVTCATLGALRPALWVWAALIFGIAAYYARNWFGSRAFTPGRPA